LCRGHRGRLAEVAAWSGRTMHRLAQVPAISRPAASTPAGPAPWDGPDPPEGNLPAELLDILCPPWPRTPAPPAPAGCACGTATAGCMAAPRSRSCATTGPSPPAGGPCQVLEGPRVRLPDREYLLFAAALTPAPQLGWTDPGGFLVPPSPNLFWPRITPGASPLRSTGAAPWSPAQRPWPRR